MTGAGFEESLGRALGSAVSRCRPISGGDINEAYQVALEDGRTVFAKTNRRADPAMFPAEARGLAWLAEAGALRVPRVIAVDPGFLVLEQIVPARRPANFEERLGHGLADLHRFGARRFGL